MSEQPVPRPKRTGLLATIEYGFEAIIFATRWLLAPAYVILAASLAVLSYKTVEEFVQLVRYLRLFDESHAILQALTIVDLVLVLNLILLVIFVGYINFVSKLDVEKGEDWPNWMTNLGYSGLKVQLLGSVIAIATIKVLRVFIEVADTGKVDAGQLTWLAMLYGLFLVAVLVISLVNLISKQAHFVENSQRHVEIEEGD